MRLPSPLRFRVVRGFRIPPRPPMAVRLANFAGKGEPNAGVSIEMPIGPGCQAPPTCGVVFLLQ